MRKTTPSNRNDKVTRGSGNVFADIGADRPVEAFAKAKIVGAIGDILDERRLTQKQAAKLMGLTQPQVSRLIRGDTREFSYERLMRVLLALGQDVDIVIRPGRVRLRQGHVQVHLKTA